MRGSALGMQWEVLVYCQFVRYATQITKKNVANYLFALQAVHCTFLCCLSVIVSSRNKDCYL